MRLIDFKFCKIWLMVALILFSAFLTFSSCLDNEFANIDDPGYILDNSIIKQPLFKSIKSAFSSFILSSYTPLPTVSFALEYHFFKLGPKIYHLNNIFLHLINIGMVFWLVYLLNKSFAMALFISVLFGFHPLRVESVAWISERKDLLFSLFYLAGLVSYVTILKNGSKKRFLAIPLVLFSLSCLSKPQALSFPFVLLAIDYFYERSTWKHNIFEKAPFFLVGVVFLAVNFMAMQNKLSDPRASGVAPFSFFENILLTNFAFLSYLIKSLVPIQLSLYYPFPEKVNGLLPAVVYISPVINLILIILILKLSGMNRKIIFAGLLLILTILPPLGTIWSERIFMHDRYTYLPHIGLFMLIIIFLRDSILPRINLSQSRVPILIFFMVYLICLSVVTFQRGDIWRNSITLWSDVILKYPQTALAYYSRGSAFGSEGKEQAALDDFNKALELSPDYPTAYVNRGIIQSNLKENNLALKDFNMAISLDPKLSIAYYHRANLFLLLQENDKALTDFDKAIELNNNFELAFNSRGIILAKTKKYELALKDFNRAIFINPASKDAFNNRGNLYLIINEYDLALKDYRKVIEIDPGNLLARSRIGEINKLKTKTITQ